MEEDKEEFELPKGRRVSSQRHRQQPSKYVTYHGELSLNKAIQNSPLPLLLQHIDFERADHVREQLILLQNCIKQAPLDNDCCA